jgi:hypothetical protein
MNSPNDDPAQERRLAEAIADMSPRTTFHKPPPDGFVPLRETAERRADFHLPEEPDPTTAPNFHRLWDDFLTPRSGRFAFVTGEFASARPTTIARRWARPGTASTKESSFNWSGAYVKPRYGAHFIRMGGSWTVPTVTRPGDADPAKAYKSSTWIGFDGQRRYRHSSLPQIGTKHAAPAGAAPCYRMWVQWWERDHQKPETDLNVPVAPGNTVRVLLHVLTPTVVRVHLRVEDTFVGAFDIAAPLNLESPPTQYRVTGATAAWVMERPSPMATPTMPYALPAFTRVTFTGCAAVAEKPDGQRFEMALNPGHLIRMKDAPPGPRRRRTVSAAKRIGRSSFSVSYKGP